MYYYQFKIKRSEELAPLREKVRAALKKKGFGILAEIDIQATMKKKPDKDYQENLILDACNSVFSDKVQIDQKKFYKFKGNHTNCWISGW